MIPKWDRLRRDSDDMNYIYLISKPGKCMLGRISPLITGLPGSKDLV